MPARQRGSAIRRGKTWAARYFDENGARRQRGGFERKSDALDWLEAETKVIDSLRRGDPVTLARQEIPTLEALRDEYLAQHVCEENTKATLSARLNYATAKFGDVRLDRLAVKELRAWRATLPQGSAWHITKALRQVLSYAVDVGLIDANPARAIPNPEPKRTEILPFATLAEVEAVSEEMLKHYRAIPIVGCLSGLRPSELLALQRRDVDRVHGLLSVGRVLIGGTFRTYGKTSRSLRVVPLPERALEALEGHPARIDTTLLFSTKNGTPIDLHNWRNRHWTPALRSAGLVHRSPYGMRHTYASLSIAAGIPTFEIARTMGTSLEQLDRTYGHLLPDSAERAKTALDAYLATTATAAGAR